MSAEWSGWNRPVTNDRGPDRHMEYADAIGLPHVEIAFEIVEDQADHALLNQCALRIVLGQHEFADERRQFRLVCDPAQAAMIGEVEMQPAKRAVDTLFAILDDRGPVRAGRATPDEPWAHDGLAERKKVFGHRPPPENPSVRPGV
jgi:hypothetical protein